MLSLSVYEVSSRARQQQRYVLEEERGADLLTDHTCMGSWQKLVRYGVCDLKTTNDIFTRIRALDENSSMLKVAAILCVKRRRRVTLRIQALEGRGVHWAKKGRSPAFLKVLDIGKILYMLQLFAISFVYVLALEGRGVR